jgi:hypothetical protein
MKTLIDGVTTGMVGAVTVAAWFLMLDFDRGQPFATPALLAAMLLHGVADPRLAHVTGRLVAEYSVAHFTAFMIFGLAAASLISATEREPQLVAGVLTLFACFEFFFLFLIGAVSQALLETLVWWRIFTANILATGAMFAVLSSRHPALKASLREGLRGYGSLAEKQEDQRASAEMGRSLEKTRGGVLARRQHWRAQ